jgi:hypothetical protein
MALVVLVLAALGCAVLARVIQIAMRRLALEPMSVLLFFGLAEEQADELSVRRAAPMAAARRTRRPRTAP